MTTSSRPIIAVPKASHRGSSGFSVIEYPEDDYDPAVYIEYSSGGAWVENQEDVKRFETNFTEAVDKAMTVDDTIALIQAQVRALERR
jgi:hypothetical protein